MVTNGTETLIGLSQDPMFGPLVAFGLGGTQVELFRDVGFRIAPLTERDADEMIHSVRGFPLLQGYRNKPPADLRALRDVLLKVSYLGAQIPELAELEFNPVMAMPAGHGCQIVDVRARVREHSQLKLCRPQDQRPARSGIASRATSRTALTTSPMRASGHPTTHSTIDNAASRMPSLARSILRGRLRQAERKRARP